MRHVRAAALVLGIVASTPADQEQQCLEFYSDVAFDPTQQGFPGSLDGEAKGEVRCKLCSSGELDCDATVRGGESKLIAAHIGLAYDGDGRSGIGQELFMLCGENDPGMILGPRGIQYSKPCEPYDDQGASVNNAMKGEFIDVSMDLASRLKHMAENPGSYFVSFHSEKSWKHWQTTSDGHVGMARGVVELVVPPVPESSETWLGVSIGIAAAVIAVALCAVKAWCMLRRYAKDEDAGWMSSRGTVPQQVMTKDLELGQHCGAVGHCIGAHLKSGKSAASPLPTLLLGTRPTPTFGITTMNEEPNPSMDISTVKQDKGFEEKEETEDCAVDTRTMGSLLPRKIPDSLPRCSTLQVPDEWVNRDMVSNFAELEPLDGEKLKELQRIMSHTFHPVRTRDRKQREMPSKLLLKHALRIEHAAMWQRYQDFQQELLAKRRRSCTPLAALGGKAQTSDLQGSTLLQEQVNEVYLWHGTSPAGALGIVGDGFRLDLAGSETGTMYGHGAYFADCSSKSDEYAKDDAKGIYKNLYCLLLCRVTLGEVLHMTTGGEATYSMIKAALSSGAYDSVLGNRKASVGTYREFVAYDECQVYPEYVLLYSHQYETEAGSFSSADRREERAVLSL